MKKLIVACVSIVLALILLVGIGIYNLEFIVKTAVNDYGPDVTKTAMRLDGADVSVLDGRVRLENFVVGNPDGFEAPHAILVGHVLVDVDETTLLKDTMIIDRIEVGQSEITYEIKGNTDNIQTIIDNIKKNKSTPKPAEKKETDRKEEEKKAGKKVIVRDLILRDINVMMVISDLKGEAITTRISELHLKNIGQKENGLLLSELFLQILNELHSEILSPDVMNLLKKEMKALGIEIENFGSQTTDKLDSISDDFNGVKDEVENIADQLKGLFDK